MSVSIVHIFTCTYTCLYLINVCICVHMHMHTFSSNQHLKVQMHRLDFFLIFHYALTFRFLAFATGPLKPVRGGNPSSVMEAGVP